jgi:thiamine biosynthesis lipoprotein
VPEIPPLLPEAELFCHEAMHTTFRLRLRAADRNSCQAMARDCFEHLDFLENRLSRFIEGSDISRINCLQAGETLYISEETHQCLLLALDGHVRTGGLFDISVGSHIRHRKSGESGPPPSLRGKITIHPDVPAVTCDEAGREIDLGGIGKGFALDQLHKLLTDWDAEAGLLAAGASSLLAFGQAAWPVDLTGNRQSIRISLCKEALSASGTGIQGSHIVHPAGGGAMPSSSCDRVWTLAATAADAEIASTALMLLHLDEIPAHLSRDPGIRRAYLEHAGKIHALPATLPDPANDPSER